jgi:hypothetical protein
MHCSVRGQRTVYALLCKRIWNWLCIALQEDRELIMHCSVRGLGTVYALLCKRIEKFSRISPFPGFQILWHRFPLLQRFHDATHTRCT